MSVKMANVQFEGQTKTKLGNPEARIACEALATEGLADILADDPETAEIIIKKSIASAKVREAARKAKEVTRQKNSIFNSTLVGKLASCTGRDAKKNELFIDSKQYCHCVVNRSTPSANVSTKCLPTRKSAPLFPHWIPV